MSKDDLIKKAEEILAKDKRFDGAKVEIIFIAKKAQNANSSKK